MDTSVSDLTLLASPLPLAQCKGLEMGEISRGDVSDIEDVSLVRLKELTLVEPLCEEAPFEEFCGDGVMGSATPNIMHTDSICTELLDSTPISSPFPHTTPLIFKQFMSPYMTLELIIPPLIHIVHT